MSPKPLPATKMKSLLENFKKNAADLAVYETKSLSEQNRKELMASQYAWVVIGKNKWT